MTKKKETMRDIFFFIFCVWCFLYQITELTWCCTLCFFLALPEIHIMHPHLWCCSDATCVYIFKIILTDLLLQWGSRNYRTHIAGMKKSPQFKKVNWYMAYLISAKSQTKNKNLPLPSPPPPPPPPPPSIFCWNSKPSKKLLMSLDKKTGIFIFFSLCQMAKDPFVWPTEKKLNNKQLTVLAIAFLCTSFSQGSTI